MHLLAMLRVCVGLCLLGLALQGHAQVRLRDDRGVAFVAPQAPQRIVTLLPSLTEGVCALGGCDRLVGTDRFSNWPAQVQRLPKLGGLEDAQVERIVALRPDVVLVEPSTRVIERLESLGVKVFVLDVQTHADAKRALSTLGQMLGTPERADREWQRIEGELDAASRQVPAALRGQRVYLEVDAAPYAAGASSFIGETLTRLGLANIVPPALGAFPRLNPEFVVQAQPDIILAGKSSLADMPQRPGWSSLRALRERRSCGFAMAQYELIVRPGPRMGEAAQLIVRCLATLAKER